MEINRLLEIKLTITPLILLKKQDKFMVQLQISAETMSRIEKITGIGRVRDGDYLVNQVIDILEKKIKERY